MAQTKHILIADPDLDAVRQLSKALRQKGYQVHYAPDGARALEVAVLRHPDLVLFDEGCQLLEARTFLQILHTNPRTSDIPVVLTTSSLEADRLRGFRDGYLKKPFNLDEVLARIDHLFRRSEAARDLKAESEIEGSLSQLGIPDLLQILSMNKRSGKLSLSRSAERGEIQVGTGRPMNAKLGPIEGEKALFRLLTWTEGSFSFNPGPPPLRPRINRAMDDALLEGMRQADEVARVLPSLPPRTARIYLAPEADLSKDQHPVTSQVVELLRQPRLLSEVVDLAPSSDLDVLTVLSTLMRKGVVRIAEGEADAAQGPLLGPAEIHALRGRILRGRAPVRTAVGKVFVCGGGAQGARRIVTGLPGFQVAASESSASKSGFGTLGRFEVSEALHIDFCVLPAVDAARPLWRPFSAGTLGALVLDDSEEAARLASWLSTELRVPLVVVGGQVPPSLVGAPAGALAVGGDLLEALRGLLIQSLNPIHQEWPEPQALTAAG